MIGAATLSVLLVTACTRTPSDPIAAARAELAAGQPQAAIIILKNALQQRQDLAAARAELGRALLLSGDAAGATLELRKAQAGGVPADIVLPLLARAMLASGELQPVAQGLDDAALSTPSAKADFATTRAEALARLGDAAAAQKAVSRALQADAAFAPAHRLQARLQAAGGQIEAALGSVQAALDADARDAESWALRGDLLLAAGRPAAEIQAAWTTALQHQPKLASAHAALLTQSLASGDAKAAQDRLSAAQAALPGHPVTLLFEGRWALLRGDVPATRQAVQQLLKLSPDDARVLLLAGEAEWRAGSATAALPWLQKAVASSGNAPGPRLLLAQVQMATDDAPAALQTLEPVLLSSSPGVPVLALAGEAQLRLGRLAEAQDLFDRAARLEPAHPRHALGRALALAAHDPRRGIAELRSLSAQDPSGLADQALASLLLRSGDRAGALRAVDELDAKAPRSPLAPMLRGQLLLQQGDRAAARQAFEVALQRAPRHLPATMALAEVDAADGRPQAGVERLAGWLGQPDLPAHARVRGAVALAGAQAAAGMGIGHVRATLQAALPHAVRLPAAQALPLHHALVQQLLRAGQGEAALEALQAALAAHPAANEAPDWMSLRAQVHLATGQPQQAVQAWRQALAAKPRDPDTMAALAAAQRAAGDRAAAARLLQQALALAPGHLPSLQSLVEERLAAGDVPAALRWAQQAQARHPTRPEGWQWEGAVHAARKEWPQAVDAWREAQARAERNDTAMKMYSALRASARPAEAARLLADWQRRYPLDPTVPGHAADTLAAAGEHAAAEALYRRVIEQRPHDAHALNNLAWVRLQQREPDATQWAEKAVAADPGGAQALDTLAQALAAAGEGKRALEVQQKAVNLAPRQPALRFTLARLALEVGDKKRARDELRKLTEAEPRFARRHEVQALERQLR